MAVCKQCGLGIPKNETWCTQCAPLKDLQFDGDESHVAFFKDLEKMTLGELLQGAIQFFDMKPRK